METKLNEILEAFETSKEAARLWSIYLDQGYSYVDEQRIKEEEKEGLTKGEAIAALIDEAVGLDMDSEDYPLLRDHCRFGETKKLTEETYQNDPYYRNIHFSEVKMGKWSLSKNYFAPYEGFVYGSVETPDEESYGEVTPVGYFEKRFSYPIVLEKDKVWMSVTPYEINTMRSPIEKAKGNVLTFGLGLGYFAYMASLKEEVKKVTIVENDRSIIALFKKNILPQFSHPEKIEIIHEDAFAFLKEMKEYDNAFLDIYHDASEALPIYLRFLKEEKNHPETEFTYWIEKDILVLLRRYLLTLVEEALDGYNYLDYENPQDEEGKILLALRNALSKVDFTKEEDVLPLLKDSALKEIAKEMRV